MSDIVKILGTGCPKCKQTARIVQGVIDENSIDAKLEKVEDIVEIMEYNILATPAVVLNEEVRIKGKVPSKEEVLALFN